MDVLRQSDVLKKSPGKLYLHVANLMRGRLLSGRWEPGDQLPRLTMLAEEFGVANVTVRQAMQILEGEGLIRRRQGQGTFVEKAPPQPTLRMTWDWSSLVRSLEESPAELILVENRPADAPALRPGEGTPAEGYRYISKVHVYDGIPCAFVGVHLDRHCYEQEPSRFRNEMIIPVLESLADVRIEHGYQSLTIGFPDIDMAEMLRLPVNMPVGRVRRVLVDQHGRASYVGELVYRGDFVKLEIELRGATKESAKETAGACRCAQDGAVGDAPVEAGPEEGRQQEEKP